MQAVAPHDVFFHAPSGLDALLRPYARAARELRFFFEHRALAQHASLAQSRSRLRLRAPACNRPRKRRMCADPRVFHYDAALDMRAAQNVRMCFDDGMWPYDRARRNLRARPDIARCDKLRRFAHARIRREQIARLVRLIAAFQLHLAIEHVRTGLNVRMHIPHIAPIALHPVAVHRQALPNQQRKKLAPEIVRASLRDEAQRLRLQNVDARIHPIADRLFPVGFFDESLDPPRLIRDDHAVFQRLFAFFEHQRRQRAGAAMKRQRA